ncbi:MAG: two-component regulator propeller domain-containing protein [Saprospiraceae bacterium]
MKVYQKNNYPTILCFAFLMATFSSCTSQSQPTQTTPVIEVSSNIPSIESKIDSSLLLKFPSGIRSILEDSKGNIWFGSHQEGVALFDGKKLTYFTMEDGLSDSQVRSIYEDPSGKIWFECGVGISSYDGKNIITHTEKNYDSINNWEAGINDLWFKGNESIGHNRTEAQAGVYRYDGNQLNYHAFPLPSKKTGGFTSSVSTSFVKGKNGMIWFGTYGGVFGYDGNALPAYLSTQNQKEKNFTIINDKSLGFDSNFLHVRSIFEDRKGNLWIGNNGIGVLIYDGKTTFNFSEKKGLISENSLRSGGFHSPQGSLEHVFSIGEDPDGNMWFGDRDTGAWKYDGKTMKNYTAEDGLTCTHIWQFYNAKNGELWLAMDDGNVLKFNPSPEQEGGKSFERVF